MTTTVSISDLITDRLSETERVLDVEDNVDWGGAKRRAIALATLDVYGSAKAEDAIGDDRIKEFIALKACARLIETAADALMHLTRLSDTKQEATFSYHDQVAILERKRKRIEQEIREKSTIVLDLIDDAGLETAAMDVSTLHADHIAASRMLTPSPWGIRPK